MTDPSTPAPLRSRIASLATALAMGLGTLWAVGAVYYDGPLGLGLPNGALAAGWSIATLVAVTRVRGRWMRRGAWALALSVVLVPWLGIAPSHDREWQRDWAVLGTVDVDGDRVTIDGYRDFDYGRDGTVTESWTTRTVRLSELRGVDLFLDAFMGEWIAHPVLSFDFGSDGRVALTIETRREVGEGYSELGGLFKLYELLYIFGDERDLVRVRTNARLEPVYLYRSSFSPELSRELFLGCVEAASDIAREPRFYNTITANCTTSLYTLTPGSERARFDLRLLLNGRLDQLLHELGALEDGGLPFDALRRQALINEAALAAHDDPAFSERIRDGLAGFGPVEQTTPDRP